MRQFSDDRWVRTHLDSRPNRRDESPGSWLRAAGCDKVFREQVSSVAERQQREAALGDQALDIATSNGKLMRSVIAAVGQAEREGGLERQREGIAKAKREGRYKGRVPTTRRQSAKIVRLRTDGVTPSEIAVRLGIGRASASRVLSEQAGSDRAAA